MIFDFCQNHKDLYAADFTIAGSGGRVLGDARLTGNMASIFGDWSMNVMGHRIDLTRTSVRDAKAFSKGLTSDKPFGPMMISIDGRERGVVFQGIHKVGLFKEYNIHHVVYDTGELYNLYPIGFGEDGSKNPVYLEAGGALTQVAQIEKDSTIVDDLHTFHCYSPADENLYTVVIFCALMYTLGCYKPGVKVTKGIRRVISITKNEELLAMYDPGFWVH